MAPVSSRSLVLIIITAGTIITGCLNSILTKYQDLQCVSHCDDPLTAKHFEQPVLQTLQMFAGESMSWLVILGVKIYTSMSRTQFIRIDNEDDEDLTQRKSKINFKNSFLFAIPASCDIMGTTLMNIGLIFTPVSIYQMVRGSVVLVVAAMSTIFLNRKITRLDWCSLSTVSLGVVIVGLSGSTASSTPNADKSSAQVIFGTLMVLLGEVFVATQFVVEEFIISKIEVVPLRLVAMEGTFGGLITLTVMLIGYIFVGSTAEGRNGPFDAINAFREASSSPTMVYIAIGIMFSIGSFNFFGISITNRLSATARSTVDTSRTLLVWVVSIYIGWEHFQLLQFSGFMLLVAGTLVFNGVIDLNNYFTLPHYLVADQPNTARVVDAIDEQIERF